MERKSYEFTEANRADIDRRFTYHAPVAEQVERYAVLRGLGKDVARAVVQLTPVSREQSIAITKLEEAIFWANAAIARNE